LRTEFELGVLAGSLQQIDDLKKHVEAAISLGVQGIHFVSAQQLKQELYKKPQADEKGKTRTDVFPI